MTTRRSLSTEALMRAARALRFALLLQGAVRWGVLSAGGLLTLLLLDNLLHLPQALRLPLAVVLTGFIAVELWRKVLRLALRPFSPAQAARWLEMHRGIAGNVLINAYHFEQDQSHAEWKKYTQPVMDSSGSILGKIPPRSLWLTPRLKQWMAGMLFLAVVWSVLAVAFPRYVVTGMERIFLPLADIPPVGSWNIEVYPGAKVSLVEGDKLDITVRVKSALGFGGKTPTPDLVWQDGSGASESSSQSGEHAAMFPTGKPGEYSFSFSTVSQSFSFSVWADDSHSKSVPVEVMPLPQLKGSEFQITPPTYTGLKPYTQPGPPQTLEVPAGSTVKATLELQPDAASLIWREGRDKTAMDRVKTGEGDGWQITRRVNDSSSYDLLVSLPGLTEPRVLGQGQITAVPDHPPEVDFVTQDRNRAVNPGGKLAVTIKATDDYGVASIALILASSDDPASARVIKKWKYLGPPGQTEPTPEDYTMDLDPDVFTPGATFLLTAQAADFSPAEQKTTSRPIIVRVAGLEEMAVPQGDALEKLFGLLKNTIVLQTQGNGLTDNLALHLAEALAANDVPKHFGGMTDVQHQAQDMGNSALTEAGQHDEGKLYVSRLQALVQGEMGLALGQMGSLPGTSGDALSSGLASLQKRQVYILNGLIALLGQMSSERQKAAEDLAKKQNATVPSVTTEQELVKLKDQLKSFTDTQKKIINASKTIPGIEPEDLTTDQQAVLGELAREEAKQAAFFQES